jgi:glucokinase
VGDGRPALAIDVGGTKLAAATVEPGGRLIAWKQVPTPRDLDAEQLWRALDALVRQLTVVPAALGQNAGLVGAAALIFAADRYWTGD